MSLAPPDPGPVLNALTLALTELRKLAALPSADPFYARAGEQVEAIVTELQRRTPPTTTPLPDHPGSKVNAEPDPNQPTPPDPG
jgi:hypothetical protein